MDYQSMATRELQEECRRRGLPTARSKAELVERLTADDASSQTPHEAPGEPLTRAPDGETPVPATFKMTFPSEPGGPDDETHLACRQSTIAAARDAGWETVGDAFRAGTVDNHEVYEVHIRRAT